MNPWQALFPIKSLILREFDSVDDERVYEGNRAHDFQSWGFPLSTSQFIDLHTFT